MKVRTWRTVRGGILGATSTECGISRNQIGDDQYMSSHYLSGMAVVVRVAIFEQASWSRCCFIIFWLPFVAEKKQMRWKPPRWLLVPCLSSVIEPKCFFLSLLLSALGPLLHRYRSISQSSCRAVSHSPEDTLDSFTCNSLGKRIH